MFQMIARVISNNIDNAGVPFARVVQIGPAVAETRPQMQERAGNVPAHSGIAIRGAGHTSFKQAENAPHFRMGIEGGHEMHFRRAWVGKANRNIRCQHCFDQRFCTIHPDTSLKNSGNIKQLNELVYIGRHRVAGGVFNDRLASCFRTILAEAGNDDADQKNGRSPGTGR